MDAVAMDRPERDLLAYWRVVRKRGKEIAALAGVATIVGVAVAFSMTEVYRGTASVLIETQISRPAQGKVEEAAPVNPFGDNLQTQVQVFKSRSVVEAAIRNAKLWEHPDFDPRAKPSAAWAQIKQMLGMAATPRESWTEAELTAALVGRVAAGGSQTIVPQSRLIKVSFDSQDPKIAAVVANAWVQAFIEVERESRIDSSRDLNAWLSVRAKDLQKNLLQAERALQEFREKNKLVAVRGASQALSTRQMEELMPKVVSARVKVTELETALKQVQAVKDGDYTTVPWVMTYGTVPAARDREIAARFKVAELSQNYGYEHPRMIQAQAELKETSDNLKRQVAVAVSSLAREYENARNTEKALNEALGQERGQATNVNRLEFQLGVLEREVEVNRQLYEAFMARGKQLETTADIEKPSARLVDPAVPNYSPVAPNRPQIILSFLLVSLALGIGVALLLDWLDNTIKGPEDAETRIGLPVITAIPLVAHTPQDSLAQKFAQEPSGVFAESLRSARTGLLLSALDDPVRVFMITSSSPGEGKTTVSANLSLALAQSKKTLLIEADMRKPRLAEEFGLGKDAKGLANLVAGNASFAECLHKLPSTGLTVICAGDIPPNPLELLSSHRFESTIESLKKDFEMIVIDTPPVELVSDALAISRVASATLFVVRANRTPLPVVRQSIRRLARVEAEPLGVILNSVDFERAHKYHGEYSGYASLRHGEYAYIDGHKVYGSPAYGKIYGYLRRKSKAETEPVSGDKPSA